MARHRKITRQEIKADRFIIFIYEAGDYITRYARELIIAAAVIVLAGAAGYWYAGVRQTNNVEAARLLAPAVTAIQQERFEDAIPTLERVRAEYAGTASAAEAAINLADAYFRSGKATEALSLYEEYVNEYGENDILILSARSGIAACLEQQEKYQEAAERYKKLAEDQADSFLAPKFLLDAGRCYQAAKQTDLARAMYDKIVATHKDTRYARDAKMALATL